MTLGMRCDCWNKIPIKRHIEENNTNFLIPSHFSQANKSISIIKYTQKEEGRDERMIKIQNQELNKNRCHGSEYVFIDSHRN